MACTIEKQTDVEILQWQIRDLIETLERLHNWKAELKENSQECEAKLLNTQRAINKLLTPK